MLTLTGVCGLKVDTFEAASSCPFYLFYIIIEVVWLSMLSTRIFNDPAFEYSVRFIVTDLLSHLFLVVWFRVRSFQKLKVELGLKFGLVYTWLLRDPLGILLSESLPTD